MKSPIAYPLWSRVRLLALSLLVGILAGFGAAVFLESLNWVSLYRQSHLWIIWLLPFAGLSIGLVYHHYGKDSIRGTNLILDEIHDPKKITPLGMAPLILSSTVLTHLFGGSAGREGTAVQIGASIADRISHIFLIEEAGRRRLLVAGLSAGFGAAIGAPWAGAVFGLEVIHAKKLKMFAWLECLIASFAGFYTVRFLGVSHTLFAAPELGSLNLKVLILMPVAGMSFGLTSRLFVATTHFVENFNQSHIKYPPLRPFLAGILLAILFYIEGSYRFAGLGISGIHEALSHQGGFWEPILKLIFTALTIGSGFKGGEFIPLVFIGATLGSALSAILPVSFSVLASVGFAALFAGAANIPVACTLMATEIFGYQILPYAMVACFVSYFVSGSQGIYKSQR
jgi:H+/Cl- antiporter ClcA